MGNYTSKESGSNHVKEIRAGGNSRIQVGNNYYESKDDCLGALYSTDPRHDKARIEQSKGGLLKDSYRWVLDSTEFKQWRDDEHSRLLWIKGDPGKGKTMLLCGILDELDGSINTTHHLSFFFCQAADSRINSATAVLRGLIYLLIKQQRSLISHVQETYDDAGKQIFEGVNAWVVLSRIFTSILKDANRHDTFLVIDALDECVTDLRLLLDFIIDKLRTSSRVKWIVSSRNWPTIEEELNTAEQKVGLSLELNENCISAAVDAYIRHKVDQLVSFRKFDPRTRDAIQQHLTSNAKDTFLWVALVCEHLKNTTPWRVLEELNTFPPGLPSLYDRMLQSIQNSSDADLCRRILAAASVVLRPLTLQELAALAEIPRVILDNPEWLKTVIGLCGSFLTLREQSVYFVHQSAKDYICNNASDKIFPSGIRNVHYRVFSKSLEIMKLTLRRDIYGLRHPGCHIKEVRRPDDDPLAAARYSCVNWIHHLCQSGSFSGEVIRCGDDLLDGGTVHAFFRDKYLYWLEALSLLGSLSEGTASMSRLKDRLQGQISTFADFVRDACRFVQYHTWAIENSPLQVYTTALIFSPARSIVRGAFRNNKPKWIVTQPTMEDDWNACIATLEGHASSVTSVAWSHEACEAGEAARIASASNDNTVRIWDPATGRCSATLEGHFDWVTSVAWSHEAGEAARVASASIDNTVRIWDPATGHCIATLEGHTDVVTSVAWSHEAGEAARVASASDDKTVRIWDPATGRCSATLEGHSDSVTSVAWSHEAGEAALVASASYDDTVRIWDPATGRCSATLEGHTDWVTSVAWSHEAGEAARVASASYDNTVRIWDPATGHCIATLEGHTDWVMSVAWSHEAGEAARVASASDDKTVRIWDPATGRCSATLEGHTDAVTSVAWSHEAGEAARVASASDDKTVRIWDSATGRCSATLEGHTSWVTSVAWSQEAGEAARVASASIDNTVRIWDLATGRCSATLDIGKVTHLSFHGSLPYLLYTNVGIFDLRCTASSTVATTASPLSLASPSQCIGYGLNKNRNWVTYNGENILWLPPEYRPSSSAISRATVVIGCPSGRMLFLGFSEDNPVS